MEDETCFSTLAFMKFKLHNRLTTHLPLVVRMFVHCFYTIHNFPYKECIEQWRGGHHCYCWVMCNEQVDLKDHRGSSKRKATSLHMLVLACAVAFFVLKKVCWCSIVNSNGWFLRQTLLFPWLWHVLNAFLLHEICGSIDVYCRLT